MTHSVHDLLSFVNFTHEIREVKRAMWVKDEEVFENDSEHSYQLAMIALYIIEQQELSLDLYKAIGLALVHDVLEVHSGDTHVYGTKESIATQQAREKEAIVKLKQQWPDLKHMHALIDEYEARATNESKFIYALDKLVPILNNYLDNGRNWKHESITLDRIVSAKTKKVSVDPVVNEYFHQILELLRQKPELFQKITT